jgi:hypothetical protein
VKNSKTTLKDMSEPLFIAYLGFAATILAAIIGVLGAIIVALLTATAPTAGAITLGVVSCALLLVLAGLLIRALFSFWTAHRS